MSKAVIENLNIRVEEPEDGVMTPSGLLKRADGALTPAVHRVVATPPPQPQEAPQEPARKSRSRRQAAQPAPVAAPPEAVKVRVSVPGLGVVPSEYRHVWTGRGVVVLGLTDMSYLPPAGAVDGDGNVVGAFELSVLPGERLVFSGQDFYDGHTKNLIMLRLGAEKEKINDNEQD